MAFLRIVKKAIEGRRGRGTDAAIVDIDLARFLWGDRSPLGRRFRRPTDPITVGAVVVVSLGVAARACWWPARRATRIDPVEVLKAN